MASRLSSFIQISTDLSSLPGFSIGKLKFCSSGVSKLSLHCSFSIVTGSSSWIRFFILLSKGQGNMKLQKPNSSLHRICVNPEGNMAMVILMLFFSFCLFNTKSFAHLLMGHTAVHLLFSHYSLQEADLPREAVVPHPWRRSRPGWMGPWAAKLLDGSSAHGTGWYWVGFKVPCSPNHSVIP